MSKNLDFDFGDFQSVEEPPPPPTGHDRAGGVDRQRGRRQISERTWILLGAVVLVGALVFDLSRGHDATPPTAPDNAASSLQEPSLQAVLTELALNPAPLTDDIRGSSLSGCPAPRGGTSPLQSMIAVVRMQFPELGRVETSQTINGAEQLCAVTLRAQDSQQGVLVVRITAPPNDRVVELNIVNNAGPTQYPYFVGAAFVASNGYLVQVGALEKTSAQVSGLQVDHVAEDPALSW